jgi:hypothetical protein
MVEDANGGNFGGRQSRDDNSLLRYGVFSMEMMGKRSRCRFLQVTKIDVVSSIAPRNKSTGLDSTPKDPVDDDPHLRIGGNQAIVEAIATYTTNKEDNRAQQKPDILSMRSQERGSDQEPAWAWEVRGGALRTEPYTHLYIPASSSSRICSHSLSASTFLLHHFSPRLHPLTR